MYGLLRGLRDKNLRGFLWKMTKSQSMLEAGKIV